MTVASDGRAAPGCGGIGAIRRRATIAAAKVTASNAKAAATPTVAMRIPPSAGPGHRHRLEAELVEGDRSGQALARDEARHGR